MGSYPYGSGLYGKLYPDRGKTEKVPKDYEETLSTAEYLKHKSWAIEYPVSDKELENAECFARNAAAVFLQMRPFNDFLNQALAGFRMPERG